MGGVHIYTSEELRERERGDVVTGPEKPRFHSFFYLRKKVWKCKAINRMDSNSDK